MGNIAEIYLESLVEAIPFGDILLRIILNCMVGNSVLQGVRYTWGKLLTDLFKLLLSIPIMMIVKGLLWRTYNNTYVRHKFRRWFLREFLAPVITAFVAAFLVGWIGDQIDSMLTDIVRWVVSVAVSLAALGLIGWLVIFLAAKFGKGFVVRYMFFRVLPGTAQILLSYIFVLTIVMLIASPASGVLWVFVLMLFGIYLMLGAIFGKSNERLSDEYLARKRKLPFILDLK